MPHIPTEVLHTEQPACHSNTGQWTIN